MKCWTQECDAGPIEVRKATPKEQIEYSTGRVDTDVFECVCGWKRIVPSCPSTTPSQKVPSSDLAG